MTINTVARPLPPPVHTSKPAEAAREPGANRAAEAGHAGSSTQISRAASQSTPGAGNTPVDTGRVAALKAAIAEGTYQVDPEQVARGMVEFESKLNGG
ncbi:MAG: flagellar biosynthesis anti-sigma factor FlgM [Gammaproteobacteria bacterium]|nr:flagellar biosynthesis anti-sigma factor FlgM [Gammaproteobacteria bacterium]